MWHKSQHLFIQNISYTIYKDHMLLILKSEQISPAVLQVVHEIYTYPCMHTHAHTHIFKSREGLHFFMAWNKYFPYLIILAELFFDMYIKKRFT